MPMAMLTAVTRVVNDSDSVGLRFVFGCNNQTVPK